MLSPKQGMYPAGSVQQPELSVQNEQPGLRVVQCGR